MKKILLLTAGLLLGAACFAQQGLQYDSMRNFLGADVALYKGQALYLKGDDAAKAGNGYQGFAKEPDFDLGANGRNVFKGIPSTVPQKQVSDYNQLAGHYFEVASVIARPVKAFMRGAVSHYLQLTDLETGETCYATYEASTPELFHNFVVVGYYEKQQQLFAGKTFTYTGSEPYPTRPPAYLGLQQVDGKGQLQGVKAGSEWKCTDVVIEQVNDHQIIALIENPDYGTAYVALADLQGADAKNAKFTTRAAVKAQAEKTQKAEVAQKERNEVREREAVSRFGQENGKSLLAGEVKVGMTKEMCKWAFGDPLKINTVTMLGDAVEIWTYADGRELQFKGKVVVRQTPPTSYKSDAKFFHTTND